MKQRNKKVDFLARALSAFLLRNLLTDKRVKSKMLRRGLIKAGEGGMSTSQGQGTVRSSLLHPLTNFGIQMIIK